MDKDALVKALAAAPDPRTPLEAAARIRSWRDILAVVGTMAELQVMAAALTIRRDYPERAAFDAFCRSELDGVLAAEKAWVYAETWEVARRQRALREFAEASPAKAVAFYRDCSATFGQERIAELDEDDRRIVEILAAPPRAQKRRMRELFAVEDAARAAAAAPGELRLVDDSPGRQEPDPETREAPTVGGVRAALERHERGLDALAAAAEALCGADPAPSQTARRQLLLVVDRAVAACDRISDALTARDGGAAAGGGEGGGG